MNYWKELITTFSLKHQEVIQLLITLLQAEFNIQEFEAFANLFTNTFALEMFSVYYPIDIPADGIFFYL